MPLPLRLAVIAAELAESAAELGDRLGAGVAGQGGQVEGDQVGMASSRPAMVVWERAGKAEYPI